MDQFKAKKLRFCIRRFWSDTYGNVGRRRFGAMSLVGERGALARPGAQDAVVVELQHKPRFLLRSRFLLRRLHGLELWQRFHFLGLPVGLLFRGRRLLLLGRRIRCAAQFGRDFEDVDDGEVPPVAHLLRALPCPNRPDSAPRPEPHFPSRHEFRQSAGCLGGRFLTGAEIPHDAVNSFIDFLVEDYRLRIKIEVILHFLGQVGCFRLDFAGRWLLLLRLESRFIADGHEIARTVTFMKRQEQVGEFGLVQEEFAGQFGELVRIIYRENSGVDPGQERSRFIVCLVGPFPRGSRLPGGDWMRGVAGFRDGRGGRRGSLWGSGRCW